MRFAPVAEASETFVEVLEAAVTDADAEETPIKFLASTVARERMSMKRLDQGVTAAAADGALDDDKEEEEEEDSLDSVDSPPLTLPEEEEEYDSLSAHLCPQPMQ